MTARQCAYCGTWVPEGFDTCQKCREPIKEVRHASGDAPGKRQIRRGLMYMWISALVFYLVKGYGEPMHIPATYTPVLLEYILPFLFLGGLALLGLGLYRRMRA